MPVARHPLETTANGLVKRRHRATTDRLFKI